MAFTHSQRLKPLARNKLFFILKKELSLSKSWHEICTIHSYRWGFSVFWPGKQGDAREKAEENCPAKVKKGEIIVEKQRLQMPTPTLIKILVCLAIILVFWLMPAPAPLTAIGMKVIGIFIGTVVLLSTVDTVWPAILAVILLGRSGVTNVNGAISGTLGNWIIYFILMSFIMTYALNESGFTDRLVAKFMSMKFVSKSPWTFTVSLAVIGLIICCFIDQVPATAFMLAFANKIYEELGYSKKDAYPHVANILVVFAVNIGGAMTPISHALAILGIGVYESVTGATMSLFSYLAFGVPTGIVLFILLVIAVRLFAWKKLDLSNFEHFDIQRVLKKQEKMGLRELVTVIVFFATVVMWMLPGVAGMFTDAPWVAAVNDYGITFWAILAVVIMAVVSVNNKPIINLKEVVNGHINWGILFFIAIGCYLGTALSAESTGVNAWITTNITPLTQAVPPIVVVFILTAAAEILTNFASNTSTVTVMTSVGAALALASGGAINPIGISLCTIMAGSCAYLMPSSFATIAMLHGNDWSNSKKIYVYGVIMMVVTSVIITFVGYNVGCMISG